MLPDPTIRACLTADEAFAELGIDRTTGYRAIKEGTFPVPVIRVGRLIRIPTAALRQLLDPATADDSRTDDIYPDDRTADTAGESPTWRLVPRPDLAHQRTQATRPERTGGHP